MFGSTKIKVQIKSMMGTVLFESEKETLKEAAIEAVEAKANLRGANLRGANLYDADLRGANLYDANLRDANLRDADLYDANLRDADLRDADLRDADLYDANLRDANLYGADLRDADLRDADLRDADLRGANLYGADLRGANLYGADLRGMVFEKLPTDYINQCSRDMLFVFGCLKGELPFLRKKLIAGEVDGTQYKGDCACLIGTLANADGGVSKVCEAIPYYEKGVQNPGEAWFWNVRKGDTPESSDFAKHAVKLIDMVLAKK